MKPNERISLLALFPRKEDLSVERFFVSLGYRLAVILLETEDTNVDLGEATDMLVLRIPSDPVSYLSDLTSERRQQLLAPRLVLNHVRNDVLAPRVNGEGTAWQVNAGAEAGMKTRTVEWMLSSLLSPESTKPQSDPSVRVATPSRASNMPFTPRPG